MERLISLGTASRETKSPSPFYFGAPQFQDGLINRTTGLACTSVAGANDVPGEPDCGAT